MSVESTNRESKMKYYCLANPIQLIKTMPSDNLLENLPIIGTPTFGRLPVTDARMQEAFVQSESLILCNTLDDALRLRQIKIDKKTNMKPDFFNKIANCPLTDYAIYEIEIDSGVKIEFKNLSDAPKTLLAQLVSYDLYFKAIYANDRLNLPAIETCCYPKDELNPQLLNCHYFPLDGVIANETTTCVLF